MCFINHTYDLDVVVQEREYLTSREFSANQIREVELAREEIYFYFLFFLGETCRV